MEIKIYVDGRFDVFTSRVLMSNLDQRGVDTYWDTYRPLALMF